MLRCSKLRKTHPPVVCLLAAITWTAAAAMLAAKFHGFRNAAWIAILVASCSYVAIGALGRPLQSKYNLFLFLALLSCWLGDVVGPQDFVWGLYAFLAAHLFFLMAFLSVQLRWKSSAHAAPLLTILAALLLAWIMPDVPDEERTAVACYTAVISTMVVGAWGARHHNDWIAPAAILFYVSDVFVARWRYGGTPINGYLCYPLYYTACVLFALSMQGAIPRGLHTSRQAASGAAM